jgi:spore coat polysaccharide biosynthesis protein SpsF
METVVLVTARLGSTRLKRKHLLEVNGRCLIQWLVDRIHEEFIPEIESGTLSVVIATSDEQENRSFEGIEHCSVYFGSPNNIPLRHLQAARRYEAANIVSVDGDDILCSVSAMRRVYESLESGAEYVKTAGLPLGMNAMGYTADFLGRMIRLTDARQLETGWTRVFDGRSLETLEFDGVKDSPLFRFTLDYPCDFDFFKKIIEHFGEKVVTADDEEIVDYVIENEVFELNRSVAEEYWRNFNENLQKEGEEE